MIRPCVLVGGAVLYCLISVAVIRADDKPGDPTSGRILFERVWATHPGGGGALGPLYNDRSCVACHAQGGIGGAGPNSKNVDLVSVEVPKHLRQQRGADGLILPYSAAQAEELTVLRERLATIHTSLPAGAMVLHAYGTDPRYVVFREQVLGLLPMVPRIFAAPPPPLSVARPTGTRPILRIKHDGATLLLTARNSTAMFGAGLINRISEIEIRSAAQEQAKTWPEMQGRFLGRFGWRGQTLDLKTFVGGACGVELGLDVPGSRAPPSPVSETIYRRQRSGPVLLPRGGVPQSEKLELDRQQFADLVAFVATLPAPGRRKSADEAEAALARRGEAVFHSADCGVCHRKSLGSVAGLYSDLLLHDLGPDLYDPQPPPFSARGSLYYDGGPGNLGDFVDNRPYEWRTPPLWGVADSGPYLHDGRAATVEEAIELHGGQAASSAQTFRALAADDRRALLTFLSTLIAPEVDYLKRPPAQVEYSPDRHPLEQELAARAAEKQSHDERAASGRLRLALAARDRGDADTARRWLEAVVNGFPTTKAALEASAQLNP